VFTPRVRDREVRGPAPCRSVCRLALVLALSSSIGLPARRALAQPVPPAAGSAAPSAAAPPETSATAGNPAPLAESLHGMARADYAAARILYEDGDYAGAYTKLEAAYAASKDPRLLWNMAACEKALRHYANVIDLLERYLTEGKELVGSDDRQATHELVETVREFVNELRLDVSPGGTRVSVDGTFVATAPLTRPLRLDMGKRKLRFEKPGYVTHETEMELSGGKSADLKVALEPELHEGTLRIVTDASAVISVDGHPVGTGMWTGTLPSGTHAVVIDATGKQSHKTDVVIRDRDTSSLHVNLIDEGRAQTTSSNDALWWIVGGVALAGAGVGGYFLLRSDDERSQPDGGTLGSAELF
jgi:hypothetical protein